MLPEIQQRIQSKFVEAVRAAFNLEVAPPALDSPPNLEMGDISLAGCFELAKQLRQAAPQNRRTARSAGLRRWKEWSASPWPGPAI